MKARIETGAIRSMLFLRPMCWPIRPPRMQVRMLAKVTRLAKILVPVSGIVYTLHSILPQKDYDQCDQTVIQNLTPKNKFSQSLVFNCTKLPK